MTHTTVAITGASAGIGRAAARAFAARGHRVGLIARDTERLQAACREVEAAGGRGLAAPADVSDAEALDRAAELIERELGPIDVWVNAAMATVFAPFHAVAPHEYRRATEVTYLGFVHGTQSALKRMRPRGRGSATPYRRAGRQAGQTLTLWRPGSANPAAGAYPIATAGTGRAAHPRSRPDEPATRNAPATDRICRAKARSSGSRPKSGNCR